MTYDAFDGYVLLFGGENLASTSSPATRDTWTFQNGVWTNITSRQAHSPAGRYAAAMTYDDSDHEVVLFGGYEYMPNVYLGDTWVFSKGQWTNVTATAGTAPSPRWRANMAYDAKDGYVVLYGGTPSNGTPMSDTWEFHSGKWTQLFPSGSPPGRYRASMAYDPGDREIVIFGGCTASNCPDSTTWVYSNLNWSALSLSSVPSPRVYFQIASDPSYSGALLFGGITSASGGVALNDTWLFSNNTWTNITSSVNGSPSDRAYGMMSYDPNGSYLLLFGGWDGVSSNVLGDSWSFGPRIVVWTTIDPSIVDLGQTTNITIQAVTKGTGLSYFYGDLPGGCTTSNVSRLSCTSNSTGAFSVTGTVNDSSGDSSHSNSTLVVDPDPAISAPTFSASPSGVGISTTMSAIPSGGTGLYSYTWPLVPPGCASSNASAIICTPTQSGSYGVMVTVTDQLGVSASNSSTLVVNSSYLLSFNESGLPSGTSWSIKVGTLTHSATTSRIAFTEINATYSYSITPIAGFSTNWTGTVAVKGANTSVSVTFAEVTYNATIHERGLPAGTNWSAKMGNATAYSTTTQVVFTEPNGTYAYTVYAVPGYVTNVSSGNLTVKGKPSSTNVTFDPTYLLTFVETGLPNGTNWSVKIAGKAVSSTSPNVTFVKPNGTYAYTIGGVPGYTTTWSGSTSVDGANASVSVSFSQVDYQLTYRETGLSPGTSWGVNISGLVRTSSTTTVAFSEPNGTYAYTFSAVPLYIAPASGNATVDGSDTTVVAAFTPLYSVDFDETGLPVATLWSVNLSGEIERSVSTSIAFLRPNGTYPYSIGPVAGYTTGARGSALVQGGDVALNVAFAKTYSLTFRETGLIGGTNWTVTVGGVSNSSTTSSIVFQEKNGTYPYSITPVRRYVATWSGSVTVQGNASTVSVAISLTFAVTFQETGLPSGTAWAVFLAGASNSSTTATIGFEAVNGTFAYSVPAVPGYTTPVSRNATVDGGPVAILVTFHRLYAVTFTESGLARGTSWGVTLNGSSRLSATTTLAFAEPNGTYAFTVDPVAGFAVVTTGTFAVGGADATVNLTFAPERGISFVEAGLPAGTNWSVTLAGATRSSTSNGIVFEEPNGSYDYRIAGVPGYSTTWTGLVTVQGKAVNVSIAFSQVTYLIVFEGSGLPAGTNWSLTVQSSTPGVGIVAAVLLTRWSEGAASISIRTSNGSFSYSASAPGFVERSGSFSVNGSAPAATSISFSPAPGHGGNGGATFLGLPADVGYGLVALAAVVLAALGLFFLRRRKTATIVESPSEPDLGEPAAEEGVPSGEEAPLPEPGVEASEDGAVEEMGAPEETAEGEDPGTSESL